MLANIISNHNKYCQHKDLLIMEFKPLKIEITTGVCS